MLMPHDRLKRLAEAAFAAAGCNPHEADRIAHYLVEANLDGHDSHGVLRIPSYLDWLRAGKVVANQKLRVLFENEAMAVVDGLFGFGQVIGEEAVRLGVAKAARQGVAVVALRNAGHLGQIGAWARLAAEAGQVSLHFVNTSGGGILTAPHGGIDRRLSANPVAAGCPRKNGPPFLMDLSTSVIAEGKIRVALNKGVQVPEGCLLDPEGRPTTDPKTFYGPPPGAILPFGGHKGYALCFFAEVFAGALTGGGCSTPGVQRVVNNMLSLFVDPGRFRPGDEFHEEVEQFTAWVKSSRPATPGGEVLMPGEPEARERARRLRDGIPLDEATWRQVSAACRALGVVE